MTQQSIQDAIAQAQAAAANSVASQALTTQSANTSVSTHVDSGAPLGLEDMLSNGVSVDHWLKLTPYGIVIGDKTNPMNDLDVFLELGSIAYCYQIKYQLNGAAKYHRSYDRRTENGGGSWMECLAAAKQIDPKAYEYRSAEIPLVAAKDILGKDGKTVIVEAGQTLGLTLPTTGWKPFEVWIKEVIKKGVDAKSGTVSLTLGHKVMKKQGVNDWAIPQFLNWDEVDQLPLFDTVH